MQEELSTLIGATIVEIDGAHVESEVMTFKLSGGRRCSFYHEQDCCETVYVSEIIGDVSDLIGAALVEAEEVTNSSSLPSEGIEARGDQALVSDDSYTWTFYKFRTSKGFVTVRWLGTSNGYYGEKVTVSLERV
jgi:hypothetical protein